MEMDKKTTRTIVALMAFAIILYLGLNNLNVVAAMFGYMYDIIFPFIMGGCIAFVWNIPMTFLSKKLSNVKYKRIGQVTQRVNAVVSLVLSLVMIVGILGLILYIVIPQIIVTVKVLPFAFENSFNVVQSWIDSRKYFSRDVINWINSMDPDWNGLLNNVKTIIFNRASSMLLSTIGLATSFAGGVINFILGFVFAIYILLQKKKLGIQCKKALYAFLPVKKAEYMLNILELTGRSFSNFITGQCLDAAILGTMFFAAMVIFNFPYALVVSALIACTALIPILGALIGCLLGAFLIVMVNPVKAGLFLVLFIVLKQIDDNVVYPRVVGSSVGLPAIWVLVAITIGGKTMGVAGMIIFIPLFSVVYVLFREEVNKRLKEKKISIQ
jgi:predicted PurR-regulated permease PerM